MISVLSPGIGDWSVREVACQRCHAVLAYEPSDIARVAGCGINIECPECETEIPVPSRFQREWWTLRLRNWWRARRRLKSVKALVEGKPLRRLRA